MARAQFWDTAIDAAGNAITTSQVTVYNRGTSTLSTVYTNESGGTLKGNPFNATTGFIDFWMEPGSYDVVIADTAIPAAYTTRTVRFDSIPAIDGVLNQTMTDESVGWDEFMKDAEGFGYGAVSAYSCTNTYDYTTSIQPSSASTHDRRVRFSSELTDPSSFYNASTGVYQAPFKGLFAVFVQIGWHLKAPVPGEGPAVNIFRNNSWYFLKYLASTYDGTNQFHTWGGIIPLNANATLSIGVYRSTACSVYLDNGLSDMFAVLPICRMT